MMLTSDFVSFVSCLDACLDAVGVRPPLVSPPVHATRRPSPGYRLESSRLVLAYLMHGAEKQEEIDQK
jgi:hypothetical protein